MASDACSQIPAVSSDYVPKGTYETIAGLKTYVIGPESPTRAIIEIYDIFGIAALTLQGADRLSATLGVLVIVPDFFEGTGALSEWLPPDTEEKKAALGKFRAERAGFASNVEKLIEVRKAAGQRWPSTGDRWGVFGLCWGGKVGVLACGAGNEGPGRVFKAGGTAHPAGLAGEDAEALTAPYICLASQGEPVEEVEKYKEILARPGKVGVVETYGDMFHGWMGARARLGDARHKSEYERGYNQIADFFAQHL